MKHISTEQANSQCSHPALHLLNPFEYVRKYACKDCLEVMMCACDKEIGTKFLSHQLREGTELKTQERISVSLGFVDRVCDECRGLKPDAHPMTSIPGRTSKIKRYYWREIAFEKWRRFDEELGASDLEATFQSPERDRIEKEVLAHFKELHAKTPKYEYVEKSQSEVLTECHVEIIALSALYAKNPSKGANIQTEQGVESVEEFITSHFRELGMQVMRLESQPFHVLFGAFLGQVICDSTDDNCRIVGFRSKPAFEAEIQVEPIHEYMPADFGTSGYGERRKVEIEVRLSELQQIDLRKQFGLGIEENASLLDYLWAHDRDDQTRAKELLTILPADTIISILRYLVDDYWRHFVGWPDLLVWSDTDWFMAEVKSSKDKLSEDQKRWITDNYDMLNLPFKLVKVHKQT